MWFHSQFRKLYGKKKGGPRKPLVHYNQTQNIFFFHLICGITMCTCHIDKQR